MRSTAGVWLAAVCCAASACGADHGFKLPALQGVSPVVAADAGPERVAECDNAEPGKPCGMPGGHLHCVFSVCVRNACGDGLPADGEECDDGNQRDLDGCDSRCHIEPAPGCGNGLLEAGEECDDGNTSDDDACTHLCTKSRCGDRIKGRGEECDDGNAYDNDGCTKRCMLTTAASTAGSGGSAGVAGTAANGGSAGASLSAAGTSAAGAGAAGMGAVNGGGSSASAGAGAGGMGGAQAASGAGASGAGSGGANSGAAGASGAGSGGANSGAAGGSSGSGTASAACMACRNQNCRDFMGLGADLVAGCYEKIDPIGGASPTDSQFLSDCQGMVQCAYQNDCAYGASGASVCYCGSASIEQCMQAGPAADAKCVAAFQKATRSMASAEISTRTSDFAYPSAWAFYLLECDRDLCSTTCVPQ